MHIDPDFFKVDRFLARCDRLFYWPILFFSLLILILLALIFPSNEQKLDHSVEFKKTLFTNASFPFFSYSKDRSIEEQLFNDILVLGVNSRPDRLNVNGDILVGLKSSGEEKVVLVNELYKIGYGAGFFSFNEQEPHLNVSFVLDKTSTLKISIQGSFFPLTPLLLSQEDYLLTFKELNLDTVDWVGQDKFLQSYGGEEYNHLSEKERLDCKNMERSYPLYVKKGDHLIYKDNQWMCSSLGPITRNHPLAEITSVSDDKMCFSVWGGSGFEKWLVTLSKAKTDVSWPNLQESLKILKMKTGSSLLFCEIDKQKLFLKPGDWLLKTSLGWHKLRTYDQIENYIHGVDKGVLFIFDKLEKNGHRDEILGHLISENKAMITAITVTFNAGEKKSHKLKNKKTTYKHLERINK